MFDLLSGSALEPVHTNSHNHALVQNPFAWDEEAAEVEETEEPSK